MTLGKFYVLVYDRSIKPINKESAMINTQVRFETALSNEYTDNIASITVVTYKSFLDGDFKTYYKVDDGRDPCDYHVSDGVDGVVLAEQEHNKICISLQKALDAVDYSKIEETWDLVLQIRHNLCQLRKEA
jgi:hypothetical protein